MAERYSDSVGAGPTEHELPKSVRQEQIAELANKRVTSADEGVLTELLGRGVAIEVAA